MGVAAFMFPAVKGFQACKEYFISMVPLEIIPRIFQYSDEELPPEIRVQRVLNKSRIPEMRDYILNNPSSYTFSSLTVSVDGEMNFTPIVETEPLIGYITIPMGARLLINDGQHRQAAIAEAIKRNLALKNEHISVVFFRDQGLRYSQQMFSDLNRYAIKPTRSINILFNTREESSVLAKEVVERVAIFRTYTEKEKTTISNRSKALFTLSAICAATEKLLKDVVLKQDQKAELAVAFWNIVSHIIPEWLAVENGKMRAAQVRKDFICSLSITLVALGYSGNALIEQYPDSWQSKLSVLQKIDWRKDSAQWENLIFVNGRVSTNRSTQQVMSNYLREILLKSAGGG